MVLLRRFCCCLDLRHGTIIIGVFSLISIICFFVIVRLLEVNRGVTQENGLLAADKKSFGVALTTIVPIMIMLLLIPSSIFLLIGASRGYRVFLLPWIVGFSFFITFFTFYMIMIMIKLTGSILGGMMFLLAVFFLCALVFEVYLLAVVISFYQEIGNYEVMEANSPGKIYSGPHYFSNGRIFTVDYHLGIEIGNEAA